jgi:hypothetical protein
MMPFLIISDKATESLAKVDCQMQLEGRWQNDSVRVIGWDLRGGGIFGGGCRKRKRGEWESNLGVSEQAGI